MSPYLSERANDRYVQIPDHPYCVKIVNRRDVSLQFAMELMRKSGVRGPRFDPRLSPSHPDNVESWEIQDLSALKEIEMVHVYRCLVLLGLKRLAVATVNCIVYCANMHTIRELRVQFAPAELRLSPSWSQTTAMVANVLGDLDRIRRAGEGHADQVPIDDSDDDA
jgi:hypothetical protein